MFPLTVPTQYDTGGSNQGKKEERSVKDSQIRKVEVKLSLFADNMITDKQKFYEIIKTNKLF